MRASNFFVSLFAILLALHHCDSKHQPRECPCAKDSDSLWKIWLDIIFVIDVSKDIDLTSVKSLLGSVAATYAISQQLGQVSRVGIVSVADEATEFAALNKYNSGAEMVFDLKNLKRSDTAEFHPELGLAKAQQMIDEEQLTFERLNVNKVVILITSKSIECDYEAALAALRNEKPKWFSRTEEKITDDNPCRIAAHMTETDITLITLGIAETGQTPPTIRIGSPCFRATNSPTMGDDLSRMLCRANCVCRAPYVQYEESASNSGTCAKVYGECVNANVGSTATYEEASRTCADDGGTLTDILSEDKDNFLSQKHLDANKCPYWVGITKAGKTNFTWDSIKDTIADDDYNKWYGQRPQNQNGDCAIHRKDMFNDNWVVEPCNALHYFSCQKLTCDTDNYCEY